LVRAIDEHGHIYEGGMNAEAQKEGWGVWYWGLGREHAIWVSYFQNDSYYGRYYYCTRKD